MVKQDVSRMTTLGCSAVTAIGLLIAGMPRTEAARSGKPGAVYVMSNEAAGNRVIRYQRAGDGTLTPGGTFATGGLGSGQFEDSSNGLLLASRNRDSSPTNFTATDRFLIATNAASNNISVFRVTGDGLELVEVEPSGGIHPVSVTVSSGVLYVLNNGDDPFAPLPNCDARGAEPNITGFTLDASGRLTPIPGSTRQLSGDPNSGCAQVSFTPDGKVLIVTERTSSAASPNRGVIDTYTVNRDGTVNGPILNTPTGIGPFGFNLTLDGFLLTTENYGGITMPGQGHAAPYDVLRNGRLAATGPSEPNFGTDTCWLVVTNSRGHVDDDSEDGDDNDDAEDDENERPGRRRAQFAYVTNFFSSSISSYTVTPEGALVLLDPLADATIGIGASDQAMSQNSRYLYARNSNLGSLEAFRVEDDGRLTKIQTVAGLPPNGIGLAAR